MVLADVVDRFVKNSPACVMVRATLENVLAADKLDEIFETHAKKQRTNELLFSTVADILGAVTCRIHPSVHSAYQARVAQIGVTAKSIYDKLRKTETPVAQAVVRKTAQRMAAIIEKTQGTRPMPLAKYRLKIVDGSHLRRTERRLKVLRDVNVAPLPGHALVVLDPRLRLAIDVFPCEDGHAQERSLLPQLLETVEPRDLWISDRNFCTTGFLWGITDRKGYYAIRQHAKCLRWELQGRRKPVGRIETGAVYEQAMRIFDEAGNFRMIRRVTVVLDEPTRDGDQEIHVLTNLPAKVSALQVADLYRHRWKIETAFQELAANLHGEIETLAYPKAALFAFCLALVSYNILSVVKAAVQAAHGLKQAEDEISSYYLAEEVSRIYRGLEIATGGNYWKRYADLSPVQMAKALVDLAANIDLARYKKHARGPKKKKPPQNKKQRVTKATHRLLQAQHS